MNRLYIFILFFVTSLFLINCEDEDVCIEEGSPKIIVKFDPALDSLNIDSLKIYHDNPFGEKRLVFNQNSINVIDSVSLALPIENQNNTTFVFESYFNSNTKKDTLKINYDYELEFISKACGYRVNYNNATYQLSQHFFDSIEVLQNEITRTNSAHIMLSHKPESN